MKQKIIGLISGTALFGGFVAAGILSAGHPTLLQCIALGAVALIGGAGAFYTYWAGMKKPLTSGNSVKGQIEKYSILF